MAKITEYPAAGALDGTEQTVADQHGSTVSIALSFIRSWLFGSPIALGSVTPNTGNFTTVTATTVNSTNISAPQLTSTVATGTPPLVVSSTTSVPNLNASLLLGSTWAVPSSIGSTTPNSAAFTTLSTTGTITQNFAGKIWEGTPIGGAKVRNWADSVAATTGNIEIGPSYNCDLNPSTGVWAGRDITDICWLEKWSDVGGVKEFWYAPSAAAPAVPVWQRRFAFDMVNNNIIGNIPSVIQPVGASVASNALTVTLDQTILEFRNATLGTGGSTRIPISAAISLVVPSGATLGTVNATLGRLILLAINNAGTMELAIVNQAGGNNLDETTLISTTAISAAATSASTIYSTNARTNVPFRVVGYIEATEATAGTWATAPSLVQGVGGQAGAAMQSLGMGQTWQTVTRNAGTTYYNTTGRTIFYATLAVTANGTHTLTVNGVLVTTSADTAGNSSMIFAPIPPGASYVIGGTGTVTSSELR